MSNSTETRSFTTTGAPNVVVRNTAGRVYVSAGPDGQIGLRITKKAHGGLFGMGGERELERAQVHTQQQGDTLQVDVEMSPSIRGVSVELELTVPARATLDLRLAAGDMRINGIAGQIRASAAAGNLEAHGVTFSDGSSLEVNAGKLEAQCALATGASLQVEVNTGKCEMRLPVTTAVNLDARVDVGAIHVSGFAGPLAMSRELVRQQVSGPLAEGASGSLTIRVNVGDITLLGE